MSKPAILSNVVSRTYKMPYATRTGFTKTFC